MERFGGKLLIRESDGRASFVSRTGWEEGARNPNEVNTTIRILSALSR